MRILLIILTLVFVSCQNKEPYATYLQENISVSLQAVRTYGPSSFFPDSYYNDTGYNLILEIPEIITITSGNAGTGWLALDVGGVRVCYQGAAPNSNIISQQFVLRKLRNDDMSCSNSGGVIQLSSVELVLESQEYLELNVQGGGCGNKCNQTVVDLFLILNPESI
jgi:hypothetical protein